MRSAKPIAWTGPMSLSTWAWMAAVTRGWVWPSDVTAMPLAKSRYALPAVSYRRWPIAVRPAAVHVAAEHRGHVGRGHGREVEGASSSVVFTRIEYRERPWPAQARGLRRMISALSRPANEVHAR